MKLCKICKHNRLPPDGGLDYCYECYEQAELLKEVLLSGQTYTVKDLSLILHQHEEVVRRWARMGEIPGAHRIGKRWLFNKKEIDDWCASGLKETQTKTDLSSMSLGEKMNILLNAHGGIHIDPETGEYAVGEIEEVPVLICDAKGNRTEQLPFLVKKSL